LLAAQKAVRLGRLVERCRAVWESVEPFDDCAANWMASRRRGPLESTLATTVDRQIGSGLADWPRRAAKNWLSSASVQITAHAHQSTVFQLGANRMLADCRRESTGPSLMRDSESVRTRSARRPRVLFLGTTYAGWATRLANVTEHAESTEDIDATYGVISGLRSADSVARLCTNSTGHSNSRKPLPPPITGGPLDAVSRVPSHACKNA
jgi:hypothetical protein